MDVLDECPNSFGIPLLRKQVHQPVKDLVDLHLQNFDICVTSRPEVDIRTVLQPLVFGLVSLRYESGSEKNLGARNDSVGTSSTPPTGGCERCGRLTA